MSWVQKVITGLVPRSWAQAIEADSRTWMIRCPCGHERSVWESGGIRTGAAGNPRWLLRCPRCGKRKWHKVYRKSARDRAAGDSESAPI